MKLTGMFTIVLGVLGLTVAFCQQPAAAPRTGPGVQAPQDAKYADLIQDLQGSASGQRRRTRRTIQRGQRAGPGGSCSGWS